eukprot:gene2317-2625_t
MRRQMQLVLQKLEQMDTAFKTGLSELKGEVSNCVNSIRMIGAEIKVVQGKQKLLETRFDGHVKIFANERYDIRSHYYQDRCTSARFYGLQLSDMGSVHSFAAPPRAVTVPWAERAVRETLRTAGVSLKEDSMCVQDVQFVQGSPQVVVHFSSIYWAQQVMDPTVKSKLRANGVSVGIDLTRAELANRRYIKQHPKFQGAVKRMPAGAKIMWRLDACVIDSKWTAQSQVWTVDSLTVAERMDVDLSADA